MRNHRRNETRVTSTNALVDSHVCTDSEGSVQFYMFGGLYALDSMRSVTDRAFAVMASMMIYVRRRTAKFYLLAVLARPSVEGTK
ncbi:hypothetical protein PAXRUDRAFT_824251 [Paxillus rubicundulus Ve08.2h10]|uniref:Uncharacterized protein n=1 Tax=Paxillus rubicundulus Ve08.2h10 TaxID=930991 RepID=A0A0D0E7Z6_9AGAM|nr:hypothetical protein PAXRUDRAFT_824251 [Paxillus rubicundulus Ve08.2h10]